MTGEGFLRSGGLELTVATDLIFVPGEGGLDPNHRHRLVSASLHLNSAANARWSDGCSADGSTSPPETGGGPMGLAASSFVWKR